MRREGDRRVFGRAKLEGPDALGRCFTSNDSTVEVTQLVVGQRQHGCAGTAEDSGTEVNSIRGHFQGREDTTSLTLYLEIPIR